MTSLVSAVKDGRMFLSEAKFLELFGYKYTYSLLVIQALY